MNAEIRCSHCREVIHEEDGWWLDEQDNLTCWSDDGMDDLGPHVPAAPVPAVSREAE